MAETLQVVFKLEKAEFGIDIISVSEIVRLQEITKMPNSPAYVDGVINLRGRVIPIVDLKIKLNLEPGERTNDTRIIVVNVSSKTIGMVVDQVSEVLRINEEQIDDAAQFSVEISETFIKGIAKISQERLIILLDIDKVFAE